MRRVLLHSLALALFALLALSQAPQVVLHPSGIVIPDLIDPVHHIWSVAILLRDVRTWPAGFVVLILAWIGWRRGGIRPWGIYALGCLVLALGPQLMLAGRLLPLPLPYAVLSAVVPHFSLFRDPTRATAGLALGLAVAAAWGAHGLLLKVPRKRLCLAVLLIGAISVESWTPLPTARLAPIPAGAYWLARKPTIHTVVVLPIANDTPIDWERQTEIMRESTVNWKWMVNGSESLDPVGMAERRKVLATYPSPASLRMLRSLRVDAVVLRLPWLTQRQRAVMQSRCDVAYHDTVETICLQDRAARTLALEAP